MVHKRVGLPVLVVLAAVLLTVAAFPMPTDPVAMAAPVGSVTLSAPLQVPVTVDRIAPGDSGSAGAYRIRYEGSVSAWLGLDADLVGPLAEGSSPLVFTITDGSNRFLARATNQVLGLVSPGDQVSLAISYTFPREAGNAYQATSASLFLLVHAVEAEQNTRFVNGKAMGPVTWTGQSDRLVVTGQVIDTSPQGGVSGCVGEGCTSEGSGLTPSPQGGTSTTPSGTSAAAANGLGNTCCQCVTSLLWLWLLYALLLVVAMCVAFHMGWRLRERSFRHRVVLRQRLRQLNSSSKSEHTP